jgi:hypothetical protein
MTATQILTTNSHQNVAGFLCLFRTETMRKWLRFNSKKASKQSVNAKFASAHFQLKSEKAN